MDAVGWIVGAAGAAGALVTTVFAVMTSWKKSEQDRKIVELDYLFKQHKEAVTRARDEQAQDKVLLSKLQDEYLHAREELASGKEKILYQEDEIRVLRERVAELAAEAHELRSATKTGGGK